MEYNHVCQCCGKEFTSKTNRVRKYCHRSCNSKMHQNNTYEAQQARGKKRKLELINRLGGKCLQCGYCKNLSALSFHHLDPSKKSFALDSRKLSNCTMEKIEEEFKKCTLLCLNCHSELHRPQNEL